MLICEDFGSIAERLRQIEREKGGGAGLQNPAPADPTAPSQAAPRDFDEWFDSLIWSTCC
ncbi:hypothetical protein [Rhodopila globiformis]|uniref:Uncharacterized protein n=1 Tax=Rhodopila globiformis TaxID=1071 RepID=A0A2S6N394_RHOGL|nr:hypothetical protein [Rhodopila globiformis]PPQ29066.1 hypothetical protein CCS01_22800 [Rhodopila globiformis]